MSDWSIVVLVGAVLWVGYDVKVARDQLKTISESLEWLRGRMETLEELVKSLK